MCRFAVDMSQQTHCSYRHLRQPRRKDILSRIVNLTKKEVSELERCRQTFRHPPGGNTYGKQPCPGRGEGRLLYIEPNLKEPDFKNNTLPSKPVVLLRRRNYASATCLGTQQSRKDITYLTAFLWFIPTLVGKSSECVIRGLSLNLVPRSALGQAWAIILENMSDCIK